MNRSDIRHLIEASFAAGRPDYARATCQTWLASSPGALGIRFYLAKALAAERQTADALPQLETVTAVDFEHAGACRLVATPATQKTAATRGAAAAPPRRGRPPAVKSH